MKKQPGYYTHIHVIFTQSILHIHCTSILLLSSSLPVIIHMGESCMRKPEEKKTVRRTVLMTQATSDSIDLEAKDRGIKPNAVMNERLEHPYTDNKPSSIVKCQDFANKAVQLMKQYSDADAKYLEREANKLWTF